MNKYVYPVKALFIGLFLAQVIATIQVYLSNLSLYEALTVMKDAGYFMVPNSLVMPSLQEFGPAFMGGLFFTLTTGAGITILTFSAVWVWDRLFSRGKLATALLFLMWAGCLALVNSQGFLPLVTCYFFVIPVSAGAAVLYWMPAERRQRFWFDRLIPITPVIVLALLWTSHTGATLFLDMRDNILLTNPVGKKVNDFYYNYTLYPAEVFKTQEQKLLKTCSLESIAEERLVQRLKPKLLDYDYLPVMGYEGVDLKIVEDLNLLIFSNKGITILETSVSDFVSNPKHVLREYSRKLDRNAFFRQFTSSSLLLGFPLVFYTLLYCLFCLIFGFFLSERITVTISAALCLLLGVALLAPVYFGRVATVDGATVSQALESDNWRERVAALKLISKENLDMKDFPVYRTMITSPNIPERYWLARTLGTGKNPDTFENLVRLLDDSSVNVVCKALESLGRREDTHAIGKIRKKIESSDHWYIQWYAYRALRTLGWKQTELR